MLEIYVNGSLVDLPPNIQITMTIDNPFLIQDRIPVPHSLTFELPPTPKNQSIFDYTNRIPSLIESKGMFASYTCVIRMNSIVISEGQLVVTEFTRTFKCFFTAAEITPSMKNALFANEAGEFTFPTEDWFDVDFTDTDNYAHQYRQWALDAAAGLNEAITVAPVKVGSNQDLDFLAGTFSMEVEGELVEIPVPKDVYAMMDQEYINYWNTTFNEFMLRKPSTIPPPTYPAVHASVFPQIRVGYLLNQLFGGRLDNNIFASGELADLVIPTTYFHNWFKAGGGMLYVNVLAGMMFDNDLLTTTDPPTVKLKSFLASMSTPNFIRELLKLFCATLTSSRGRFKLLRNKDIVFDSSAVNWDEKLIGVPTIGVEKGKVYRYGYGESKSSKLATAINTVSSLNEMINDVIAPTPSGTTEVGYFIETTNQTFLKRSERIPAEDDESEDIIKDSYELLDSGFGQSADSDGSESYDVTSSLKPLPVVPAPYWWSASNSATSHPDTAWWGVPQFDGERETRPELAGLCFYRGIVPAPQLDREYPLLTPYSYDTNGDPAGNLSLAWDGEDGLINRFHKEFKAWMERDKAKVSSTVRLTALDLHNLDITKKVYFHGRKFYIKQLRFTIEKNKIQPAIADFIEA